MKQFIYTSLFFFGMLLVPQMNYAQVDFNKTPDDDLGNVSDEYQELFFEALKQKAIQNYDKAVTALQKCIDLDDSESILYFELGKNYNKLKNYGAAEEALKKAISITPENEWYLDELYEVYVQEKEFSKAIKTVKKLVKFHPDYKEDLASIYVRTKKYKEALTILDELDVQFGVSTDRDKLRNQIYNLTGRKKEQIENLEERVDKNPDAERNYLELIYRYSESNNKEKAFETAKKLLEINPESKLVHLALYKFYLDDNTPEKAIESMRIVLNSPQIKPEAKTKVLADFVKFVASNPQYEDELVSITSEITKSATNGKTLVELAQYYLVKGDKQKAINYYLKAQQLEQDNFGLIRNILLLRIDLEEYKLAENESDRALEKFPSQPVLYLINGVALNRLNRFSDAVDTLDAGLDYILEDTKMEADFYKQLSKAYTGLNNLSKAKTFSDKAKKLEPSN